MQSYNLVFAVISFIGSIGISCIVFAYGYGKLSEKTDNIKNSCEEIKHNCSKYQIQFAEKFATKDIVDIRLSSIEETLKKIENKLGIYNSEGK